MPTNSPAFVSIIKHDGRALLVHSLQAQGTESNEVLKFNAFSNMALDHFESDLYNWTSLSNDYPDIKPLFRLEDINVFGRLIKQTGLKIIVGFRLEDGVSDEEVANVFREVSTTYVRSKCNPFVFSESDLVEQLKKAFTARLT
ncbi:LAMI_0D08548g1_1 [Lachancea mirantina]|uniref:LAMI_0D08548g1_1 n=1 Tax=Lachancea mirantina TaxID=1230905 RepID=A0A1G4JD93_9SACH|nr:LAMI_0D08548g1_1 [Lachancea mirantina]